MNRRKLLAVVALLAVAALHYAFAPRTLWEYDENFFAMGVEHYQPLIHHPPPPGAPIFIGMAKLFAPFTSDAFHALLFTNVLAVAAGLLAFFFAFREISSDGRTAVVATLLLFVAPAVIVSALLAQSDAGSLALLGIAIWGSARRDPWITAIAAAAAVGWRPQNALAVVPMFLTAVVIMRTWRDRVVAVLAFGVACLAWLVPVVLATGGPLSYWKWLSGQAAYYAAHDASLSRSGRTLGEIALRFVAHPWGPKWLSMPFLLFAACGAVVVVFRRNVRVIPVATGSIVFLVFAIGTMDPADAVRYAIPALPFIAFLAAAAICAIPSEVVAIVGAIAYAAGSVWYAWPILHARATSPSPPAAAISWIRSNLPPSTVVLYDAALLPHGDNLLREWRRMRIDPGLAKYGADPSTGIVILADGERRDARGVTFRWPDSDAYRKLTRQHYGAVSVIPVPPRERFQIVEGIYPPERTRDGESWRWIGARGIVELPPIGAKEVRIALRTPVDYPLDANRVRIDVTPAGASKPFSSAWLMLRVDRTEDVALALPQGAATVTFTPERTFVPAEIATENNRDPRRLSVMLTSLEQR